MAPPRRFRGVRHRSSNRSSAEICVSGEKKKTWLGTFDTAEEAARAYDFEAVTLAGSKAKLNFPDEWKPFMVDSSTNKEQDNMSQAKSANERASEEYVSMLVQPDPQLIVVNHAFYESVKDEGEVEANCKEIARRRAECEDTISYLDELLHEPEESDDPLPWGRATANDHEAGPAGVGVIPISSDSDSSLSGFSE